MDKKHVTVLEIDLNAVAHNLNYFKSKLHNNTQILVVVKAFGYGSWATEVARFLAPQVDYFAVAYTDEGIAIREAGIETPILVLHPQISNIENIIQYNFEPNIYSFNLLNAFVNELKSREISNFPIHIKFNTGLNRLGFSKNDVLKIATIINNQTNVAVRSIFSHVAASEDLNERDFTLGQINSFKEITIQMKRLLKRPFFRHMLNTSGIINYADEAEFEMVRLGIGLYGFANDFNETEKLHNVICLKSIISQIHQIKKGETVGYNRAFKAETNIRTATIPIGHADGISRKMGNGAGYVFINSKKALIVGNVCMDMIMVDVSNIDCKEGDIVTIYKDQQHIEDLATRTGTISYELITAISQRIKRVTN